MSTRRKLLAQAGCATAAGAALGHPRHVLAAVPDPHPAWHAEVHQLRELINSGRLDTDELADPPFYRMLDLEQLIAETPATTVAGISAQLGLVCDCHFGGSEVGKVEEAALVSAMDALARLGDAA